jgi:DNA invertase Pin-like site-specific DNA recombinase
MSIVPLSGIPVNSKVLLYCRASSPSQKESLTFQVAYCNKFLADQGYRIFATFQEVACGRSLYNGRYAFLAARRLARKSGLPIVAYSVLRFVRERTSKAGRIDPADLDELEGPGIVYATILPPETPLEKIKSEETRRGMYTRRKMGGKPKAKIDAKTLQRMISFREDGNTYRTIAMMVGLDKSTVWRVLSQKG